MSAFESASGPITATFASDCGERQQLLLVRSSTIERCAARRASGAVLRVGEHGGGARLVGVGLLEEAEPHLHRQDPPHRLVDLRLLQHAVLHERDQVLPEDPARHVHVEAGGERARGGVLAVPREALGQRLRTAIASLTTKPEKPHSPRRTSRSSHGLAPAGTSFRSM